MNTTKLGNLNINQISIFVVAVIILMFGIMIHLFIVAVNFIDWAKKRLVTTTDQIFTNLAITRLFHQAVCLLDIFCHVMYTRMPLIYFTVIECIWSVAFYASIWLSALLSVVYCLKVANFHHVIFLRLKAIVLQKVIRLIIASFLISAAYSALYSVISGIEITKNLTNGTFHREIGEIQFYIMTFWNIMPFFIFVISSVFLIVSLHHHMKRMQSDRNVTGHLHTYYKTIKFLTVSTFSYTLFLVTGVTIWFYETYIDIIVVYLIYNGFPTVHSIYLIYFSSKIRIRLSGILQQVPKCLFYRKYS